MTKPTPDWRKQITDALNRFTKDTEGFTLTIAHDDGLYRHMLFRAPEYTFGSYWFDLHTAPGTLTFRGDMGTWVFSRTEDMFSFFRVHQDRPGYGINPSYWAEKVIARDRHGDTDEYDRHVLARAVHERAVQYAEWKWPIGDDGEDRERRRRLSRSVVSGQGGDRARAAPRVEAVRGPPVAAGDTQAGDHDLGRRSPAGRRSGRRRDLRSRGGGGRGFHEWRRVHPDQP